MDLPFLPRSGASLGQRERRLKLRQLNHLDGLIEATRHKGHLAVPLDTHHILHHRTTTILLSPQPRPLGPNLRRSPLLVLLKRRCDSMCSDPRPHAVPQVNETQYTVLRVDEDPRTVWQPGVSRSEEVRLSG